MIKRPMLAPREDPLSYKDFFRELTFPSIVSPKIDGIRGVVTRAGVLSRTMKMLPSAQVQAEIGEFLGLDGELVEGEPNEETTYNRTQSHVMSYAKEGNIRLYAFDWFACDLKTPYEKRLEKLINEVKAINSNYVELVPYQVANNLDELFSIEKYFLERGYEGVMLRNPLGRYKENRATWLDDIIKKLKRFKDTEGIIVDVYEASTNTNEAKTNELGLTSRSTSKLGKVAAGTLGGFMVDTPGYGIVKVGPGAFNHDERYRIFKNKEVALGEYLKFRYFEYGEKDLPRQARAIGFRNKIDM